MKVDLAGLLLNAARVIRDHGCDAPFDAVIAFGLEEAAKHVNQVRDGKASLVEFCELYCLPVEGTERRLEQHR